MVAVSPARAFLFPATALYCLAVVIGLAVAEPMSCAAARAAASLEACSIRCALMTLPPSTTRALIPTREAVAKPAITAMPPRLSRRSWLKRKSAAQLIRFAPSWSRLECSSENSCARRLSGCTDTTTLRWQGDLARRSARSGMSRHWCNWHH